MLDDLLNTPETAYVKMIDQEYKAEQDLADRYRSFVAEILRLSLGGLAVFSFIYKSGNGFPKTLVEITKNHAFALSGVAMFALSAACALIFLYCSSEGLRWYIAGLRYRSHRLETQAAPEQAASGEGNAENDYLAERLKWVLRCRWSKLLAAIMLGLGGISMALAIIPFS